MSSIPLLSTSRAVRFEMAPQISFEIPNSLSMAALAIPLYS
jgi:hypothetical protein